MSPDRGELATFQAEVGQWANTTFPLSTWTSITNHLCAEIEELAAALYPAPMEGRGQYEEEAADCFLLLLHLAHKEGFDLLTMAREKHQQNRARTWEVESGEKGYWRHVTEGGDMPEQRETKGKKRYTEPDTVPGASEPQLSLYASGMNHHEAIITLATLLRDLARRMYESPHPTSFLEACHGIARQADEVVRLVEEEER